MQSMTGYGKGESENEKFKVTTFIRSVNGKVLDISLRSNMNLIGIEPNLKKRIKDYLKRGNVNVVVEIKPKTTDYALDTTRLRESIKTLKSLTKELDLHVSDDAILNIVWRYAERLEEELDPELEKIVEASLDEALMDLVKSRKEEGENLKRDIEQRLSKIQMLFEKILETKDKVYENIKSKVLEKAQGLNLSDRDPLVLNEITFLLSKMDIEEEITRFKSHISKAWNLINSDEEVGKKLDFILQEMHREINTLGNKLPDLSEYVVEIKTEIDRLKQQAANVE